MCSDIKVDLIRKRVPAVVFVASKSEFIYHDTAIVGLWVEPTDTLETGTYPHWQLEERMNLFVRPLGVHFAKVSSASVFIDGDNQKHLVLDTVGTARAKEEKRDRQADSEEFWVGLAREYNLASVLGDSGMRNWKGEQARFADSDLLGRLREEDSIFSFAKEKGMTNTQWLRFRMRFLSAKEAGIALPYDRLAQEIINQDSDK